MIKIPFTGTVKQAFGKPLNRLSVKTEDGTVSNKHGIRVLNIAGSFDGYSEDEAGYQEIVNKGEAPDHMEVVRWKNAKLLAAAKGQANAAAVKAAGFVEPTAENDPLILLNTFKTAFLAVVKLEMPGASEAEQEAEARKRAAIQAKQDWPDSDDE